MGKTTITVQDSTLERFKELKAELDKAQDAPDHSADTFLSALLDTWEKVNEDGYGNDVSVNANVIEKIAQRVERLDHDVSRLVEQTEPIANGVENMENVSEEKIEAFREELEKMPERTAEEIMDRRQYR